MFGRLIFFVCALLLAFIYGLATVQFEIFPYEIIRQAKNGFEAYKLLGREEGVFCEPASAASVAGLLKRREEVPPGATVVCVLTGNGLKDPTTAIEHNDARFHTGLAADTAKVAEVMGF